MIKYIIFVVFIGLTGFGYSADKKHPLDIQIDKLIEGAQATVDQVEAINKGYELWDKELNAVYQKLKKMLDGDAEAIKSLKDSQLAWIKFRDNEFILLSSIYKKLDGTMYASMEVNDRLQIVRARAMELSDRLLLLQE